MWQAVRPRFLIEGTSRANAFARDVRFLVFGWCVRPGPTERQEFSSCLTTTTSLSNQTGILPVHGPCFVPCKYGFCTNCCTQFASGTQTAFFRTRSSACL